MASRLDLTADVCRDRGVEVDEAGFDARCCAKKPWHVLQVNSNGQTPRLTAVRVTNLWATRSWQHVLPKSDARYTQMARRLRYLNAGQMRHCVEK